jgi:hypothetical protein
MPATTLSGIPQEALTATSTGGINFGRTGAADVTVPGRAMPGPRTATTTRSVL